jgi:hypothetical protein
MDPQLGGALFLPKIRLQLRDPIQYIRNSQIYKTADKRVVVRFRRERSFDRSYRRKNVGTDGNPFQDSKTYHFRQKRSPRCRFYRKHIEQKLPVFMMSAHCMEQVFIAADELKI